jgi:CelD/BcsL family acetyltransferase involved in cellulose biosynthesis
MRPLGWAELDSRAPTLDSLAEATPEIDGFCSSTAWVLPARLAFAPGARPMAHEVKGAGAILFMLREMDDGSPWACPLEAVWGLASPLLGGQTEALVEASLDLLHPARPGGETPRVLVMAGLAEAGQAMRALQAATRRRRLRLTPGPTTGRIAASLAGGMDGFWSRRSAKFRATARRAQRQAEAAGVSLERVVPASAEVAAVWQRILAIETTSRKFVAGGGLAVPEMQVFYADMLPRLAARRALRVVFVRDGDGADLAYVFGGLFGQEYRGLQVSFDDRHAARSPGVLAHLAMLTWLTEDGMSLYDLGTDMPYKLRWGEPGLTTRLFLVGR